MTNNNSTEKSKQKNLEFIPNFTQYPNEILDNWMPHLSGNQTKIINVFVRQIYGYHKDYDKISVRQISFKTGIPVAGVFRDLKILLSIGAIRILKKGDKSNPHTYQIVNVTEVLSERIHHKKSKGVITEITGCYRSDNSGVIEEITEVLSEREQQKKEINIKESVKEREPLGNPEQFGKTEQPHTQTDPDFQDPKIRELAQAFGIDLDNPSTHTEEETQLTTTKQDEISLHYSNEIAKVEQEYNLQRDISIQKLSIESLLEASEDFLGRVGIGFDNNPRRILNLIYKQLPKDFVIKEDSKDVEILGDLIKKYTSSNRDERESIAKRIYQSVEAMLKIYVIKKHGEPYRDIIYPDIAKSNLALYLNCNPTFKYCLGGFSNDIDGVYTEICRLAEKDAKKKVSQIKIEHDKKIRSLETDRLLEMQSVFSDEQKTGFQERTDSILRRMDTKKDIFDQPLAKPIQINLTEAEKEELNKLFVKQDKTNEDVLQINFLIKKSKK
jgi:hypothetical protein